MEDYELWPLRWWLSFWFMTHLLNMLDQCSLCESSHRWTCSTQRYTDHGDDRGDTGLQWSRAGHTGHHDTDILTPLSPGPDSWPGLPAAHWHHWSPGPSHTQHTLESPPVTTAGEGELIQREELLQDTVVLTAPSQQHHLEQDNQIIWLRSAAVISVIVVNLCLICLHIIEIWSLWDWQWYSDQTCLFVASQFANICSINAQILRK